ncbi:hypothetical protein CSAL01_02891 [Colletotrichum salicis]|uniref:Uncharacterized protein n=1 Tax=Colletotrichum salicis TaxID=1209931 RepID=A0A135S163_9PEZI|nr:hypothetical protein CSAL01_02891 [Colletotrichum salicis]
MSNVKEQDGKKSVPDGTPQGKAIPQHINHHSDSAQISLGQTLFQERAVIEHINVVNLWGPHSRTIAQCVESYYSGLDKPRTQPSKTRDGFRYKALKYYGAQSNQYQAAEIDNEGGRMGIILAESDSHFWCHATGSWVCQRRKEKKKNGVFKFTHNPPKFHAVVHIVPHFTSLHLKLLRDLFREIMTDGPDELANALLLSEDIKGYFDSYKLLWSEESLDDPDEEAQDNSDEDVWDEAKNELQKANTQPLRQGYGFDTRSGQGSIA